MTLNKHRLAVVIPAMNESTTIKQVVDSIIRRDATAIVVDDGSTDQTARIAREAGAFVIEHEFNKGYEPALTTGVHAAAEQGFELVATFDADGQLDPDDVITFVSVLDAEKCDLVIGIRDYRNRYAEYLLSVLGRVRFGIKDPLCGLKLYRLQQALPHLPFDSHKLVGMELAFKMIDSGCSVLEKPIHVQKRNGASRYGSSLKGEARILKSLFNVLKIFGFQPTKENLT